MGDWFSVFKDVKQRGDQDSLWFYSA